MHNGPVLKYGKSVTVYDHFSTTKTVFLDIGPAIDSNVRLLFSKSNVISKVYSRSFN